MTGLTLFFSRLLSRLPLSWRWALGAALGDLWWILKIRRFTLYRNISIVFPEKSHAERKAILRQSLRLMGYNLIEILQIPQLNSENIDQQVIFEGWEHYEKAAAQGKGVLFLSLHLGNGDLGVTGLSLKGLPLHLISKKFKNQRLNRFWFGLREMKGTRFIDPHGRETAFQILKALRNRESVVFVIDQFMGRPYGIPTTFFGVPTATAYGLALFAAKTRAPVLPVYTYRDQDLKLHIAFSPEVPLEEGKDKDLQMQQMTQKYNGVLENLILRHPVDWMWVHRRWKKWE